MTRLPEMTKPASNDTELRQRDKTQKAKMKNYADKKRSSHHRELKVGDKVFVKKSTRFAAMPYRQQLYEVIAVKGTMITAKHGQHVITRNIHISNCTKVKMYQLIMIPVMKNLQLIMRKN